MNRLRTYLLLLACLAGAFSSCVPPADVVVLKEKGAAGGTVRVPIVLTRRDLGAVYLRLDYDHAVVASVDCNACSGNNVLVTSGLDFTEDLEGDLGILAIDTEEPLPMNAIDGCTFQLRPDAAPGIYPVHIALALATVFGADGYAPVEVTLEDGAITIPGSE